MQSTVWKKLRKWSVPPLQQTPLWVPVDFVMLYGLFCRRISIHVSKKFFFCDQNPALYCIVGVAWGTGEEKGGSPYEYFNSSSLCVPEMVPLFSLEGLHNEFHRKNIKKSLKKCIVQGLCAPLLPSCFCLFVQIQMDLEISRWIKL